MELPRRSHDGCQLRRDLCLQLPVRGRTDRLPLGRRDGGYWPGHGITDDSVASHPFFGTKRVVDALKECPGFYAGRVDLLDGAYVRAAGNRYVSAIDPDRVVGLTAPRTVRTMIPVESRLVAVSA